MKNSNEMTPELLERNLDINVDFDKIDSPALKRILKEFSDPEIITKLYDKHSDWGQQGQCGCVLGCMGG